MFEKCFGKQLPDHGLLVSIIDLITAYSLTDPGLRNPLRITNCYAFVLKGQIACWAAALRKACSQSASGGRHAIDRNPYRGLCAGGLWAEAWPPQSALQTLWVNCRRLNTRRNSGSSQRKTRQRTSTGPTFQMDCAPGYRLLCNLHNRWRDVTVGVAIPGGISSLEIFDRTDHARSNWSNTLA